MTPPKRKNPETILQIRVNNMLKHRLPDDVFWTASLTGVYLSPRQRTKAKAMGVRRGWTDLTFLCPDVVIRIIELKAGAALSKEQRQLRDMCLASGKDIWALCRSVEDVEAVLTRWGVPLRAAPPPGSYDDGLTMVEAFS